MYIWDFCLTPTHHLRRRIWGVIQVRENPPKCGPYFCWNTTDEYAVNMSRCWSCSDPFYHWSMAFLKGAHAKNGCLVYLGSLARSLRLGLKGCCYKPFQTLERDAWGEFVTMAVTVNRQPSPMVSSKSLDPWLEVHGELDHLRPSA